MTDPSAPVVSVVVPCYNHARFLPRRLGGILAQDFGDYELILLDDASPDDSRAVLADFAGRADVLGRVPGGVRTAFNDRNSGSPFAQWNRGVGLARGEFVWIAESDDDADPRLLGRLVELLRRHPAVGLAYCQSAVIDDDGRDLGVFERGVSTADRPTWGRDWVVGGAEECRRHLAFRNTVPNASAVVFRRSTFLEAGGAEESMRLSGDWMTWARLAARSDVAYLADPLNRFRKHAATVRSATRALAAVAEHYRVVGFLLGAVPMSADEREAVRDEASRQWLRSTSLASPDLAGHRAVWRAARGVDDRLVARLAARGPRLVRRLLAGRAGDDSASRPNAGRVDVARPAAARHPAMDRP